MQRTNSRVAPPPPPITSPDAEWTAQLAEEERAEAPSPLETTETTAPIALPPRPRSDLENTVVARAIPRRPAPDGAGATEPGDLSWQLDVPTAERPAFPAPVPAPPASAPSRPAIYDDVPKTRIGTPAYREEALTASAPPDPLVPEPDDRVTARGPVEKPMQAVRVVVWRGPNGVHIAPHGTTVSAISVDAMLVALDPAADLYAWLTNE